MKTKIMIACIVAGCIGCCFFESVFAAGKPVVAIKKAIIGEGISPAARKHLNLDKLLAEMEASFLATRKLTLVSRKKSTMQAILDEQEFARSEFAAGDAAESGAMENADFLVIPEVCKFVFYAKTHKVPNLENKYFRRDRGTLEVNAQIVDTRTGQIKTTFSMKDSFSTRERMVNRKGGVPDKKHFSDLAKAVSAQMADQFIATVFPMKIIKVKDGNVYLNRGKDGGLKKGDILDVYLAGEALIDPDTGDVLGAVEEYIGKIKVSKINPKFTIAAILQDKLEGDMSVGCIVRKP